MQISSWRNIKWDGNKTLDELSYKVAQLGKALGLNDKHILDTFKLGLSSNIYVNLVHIDGMQATFNMAKRLMAVSKWTSPGARAVSNIPFMAASSHAGLASHMYQKSDISKQVTFQDPGILSGLQISIKNWKVWTMTYMPWEQRNVKDLEDILSHQVIQIIEVDTGVETIPETVLETHSIETEEQEEDPTGPDTNLETIQVID